jgi:Na+/melibiose symporter-like transporter
MYFAFAVIYIVLVAIFIVDVLRQPASALSGVGKAIWIVAVLVVPVLAWIVYGFWRIKRSRL